MNFFNWEFSKEAQPELNKFLQMVNQNKNDDCKMKNEFLEIFPELKEQQNDLENSIHIEENKDNSVTNNDIILIDSDDEIMEIEPKIKTELPDISILNLTQAAANASDIDVLNTDVDVFIEYQLECLENENLLLEKVHVTKLANEYNDYTLNYLFSKLSEMSDIGLCNLTKSICKYSDEILKSVPELFCKIILFSKLQNINPTKKMLSAVKEFCENFPEVIRQEIIVLFLVPDYEDNNTFFQKVINMLSDLEKQCLLRDFVFMANELVVWQLPYLELLLSPRIEDNVNRRLLNLMEISADKFETEKLFIKFLIAIINNLENGFEDQDHIIYNIIEKSKTTNKIPAQKAYKKWTNKYNIQQ